MSQEKVTNMSKQDGEVYFGLFSTTVCKLLCSYSSLNMLSVEDRVKQLRLNHVFNIFHQKAPNNMQDNFVLKTARNYGIETRSVSNLDFNIPRVRTCQSSSFYYSAIQDWNELPLTIKRKRKRSDSVL